MKTANTLTIDGLKITIEGEKNLLEVIRKAHIDIPTFCYHSELSIYGACRLCMVDVSGRGVVPSCSTPPEAGMEIQTSTGQIRSLRKMIIELLLANHEQSCTTCQKNTSCKLQELANRFGVTKVRFKKAAAARPLDNSSPSITRDPNKCILCGDCVRMCREEQSVGAIDFAFRGSNVTVAPSFGKGLSEVECVNCGQCARVCPTGALTPKSDVAETWKALEDKSKYVIVQIAPAVRVAIGEHFGLEPGTIATGQAVAALKRLGFKKVFDTSFTADLTIMEEGTEFLKRLEKKEKLPIFTSCCPGWVKFAEQYYPELNDNLSSCRSPQQMFGSLAKELLPEKYGIKKEDLVIVSVMPCTAKKYEAAQEKFAVNGIKDIDIVLTTQEFARMIEEAGLQFNSLTPESFDLPFGFKTGAGIIFGNSGGVSEAVLRFVNEKVCGKKNTGNYDFLQVRGLEGIKETSISTPAGTLKLAVASGLKNARTLVESMKRKEVHYDIVEIMACPGGCIGGAGQPVYYKPEVKEKRAKGLYDNDKMLELHSSQDNPYIKELYKDNFGEAGSRKAHRFLHTHYASCKRTHSGEISILKGNSVNKLEVTVCFGTSCFLKGSQSILKGLVDHIKLSGLEDKVEVKATFCFEKCNSGPNARIGRKLLEKCTIGLAVETLMDEIKILKECASV